MDEQGERLLRRVEGEGFRAAIRTIPCGDQNVGAEREAGRMMFLAFPFIALVALVIVAMALVPLIAEV